MNDMSQPHPNLFAWAPRPWLLADIGGTNARFGWLASGCETVAHVQTLPTARYADPAAAARHYLDGLAQHLGAGWQRPRAAALAVATAVAGDRVSLTNSGWAFSCAATQAALGLDELAVLNDFEALALSLPHLQPQQVQRVGPVRQGQDGAAMAVIGPGTGLGVAGIMHAGDRWVALPGEGGHSSLSAADDYEAALMAAVRREHAHVSAERLLSGIGLPVLHQAVATVAGQVAPVLTAEQIVERGLAGSDALCVQALDSFCALLGSFAGNVALMLGARGGVFIGGGIVPRLGERFGTSRFRERFEAKGRFADYLAAIPTAVITDTLVALRGCAVALEQRAAASPLDWRPTRA
jgi:glucokinase